MNLQELGFNGIGTLDTETAARIVNNTFSTNEVIAHVGEEAGTVEIETSVIERDPRLRLTVGFGSDRVEIESNGDIRELVPFTTGSLYAMIGRLSVDGLMLLMEENHVNTHSVDSVFEFLKFRIHDFYELDPFDFQNFFESQEIYQGELVGMEVKEENCDNEYYKISEDGELLVPFCVSELDDIVAYYHETTIMNATIKGSEKYV